jgi:NADH dehydrogenase (ubiquinone) 1 beta subcomplex subunit 7
MGGSTMQATQKELVDAKIELAYRDFCAHLLIPLNECRRKSCYLPWKCEHERHVYEKCQYKE